MTNHYDAVIADLEAQRGRIDVAIAAIKALRPPSSSGEVRWLDLEEAPNNFPPAKPKRVIPTDPELLRETALQLMNSGLGMNEVKAELNLTTEQADAFFHGK